MLLLRNLLYFLADAAITLDLLEILCIFSLSLSCSFSSLMMYFFRFAPQATIQLLGIEVIYNYAGFSGI